MASPNSSTSKTSSAQRGIFNACKPIFHNPKKEAFTVNELIAALQEIGEVCEAQFRGKDLHKALSEIDLLFGTLEAAGVESAYWINLMVLTAMVQFHESRDSHSNRWKLKDQDSTVYVLKGEITGFYKIGVAVDAAHRIKQIAAVASEKLELIYLTKGGIDLETALHRAFFSNKLHGEWFKLDSACEKMLEQVMKKQPKAQMETLGGLVCHSTVPSASPALPEAHQQERLL